MTKCLTYGQVTRLALEGLEIRIMKGCHPKGFYGQFWSWLDEIRIYPKKEHELRNDKGRFVERTELENTLIHELVHAKYYYLYDDMKLCNDEKLACDETDRTMERYPNLYCYILQIFELLQDKTV